LTRLIDYIIIYGHNILNTRVCVMAISRYEEASHIQKRTNQLAIMREQGQTSNPEMIECLDYLEQALKQKRIHKGEDKLRAIYALAVHNPHEEKYARLLSRYMYAARNQHHYIAEALVLGRKATDDIGFDADSKTDPKSPLQNVVTAKLEHFIAEGHMRPKKVRQLFGEINAASEKIMDEPANKLLAHLGKIHSDRQAKRNFVGKLEDFVAYGLEVVGIHVDGLRPAGVEKARKVESKLRQTISVPQ
jgi:hypothetical protein